jgi:membrane protein
MSNSSVDNKGHEAEKPKEIPKKGWKDIATRVKDQIEYDHVQVLSAGIAFYFFLALFPTIAAAISIYGLVMEPAQVEQQMSQLANILPSQAHEMISGILKDNAGKAKQTLGWSLAISILFSLWSANKGTKAVFEGVNIAYDEIDERSFFKKNAITLLFTLGGIIIGFICITLVVGFPAFIKNIGLPSTVQTIIQLLRWPLMAIIIIFPLAAIYKVAPDRDNPQFKWTSWGAVIATLFWLAGSLLFSLYVNKFGSFDKTYGSFATVIILMLWFFLTAFIVLLGAEINSEMEHQTRKDTTVGEDKPMGQRGGYHPDHIAGQDKEDDKNR